MSAQRTPESKDLLTAHLLANRGLITRHQARALGLSDTAIARLISSHQWIRVFRSVYRSAIVEPTWEQSLLAACLAGGKETVAFGRAAARLHGLDGRWDDLLEVTSPKRLRLPGVRCHLKQMDGADRTVRNGIPVTTVERTILDLAGSLSKSSLEIALDSSLRQRKTTMARLRWRVSNASGQRTKGIGALRALLQDRAANTESPLETRLLQIIRRDSLPLPLSQFRLMDGTKVVGRFDFAYPNAKVIIEVDGYRWHAGKDAWQRDRSRDNALNRMGWTVLRFTAEDLRSPEGVIEQIRDVLYPPLDTGVR